jgi:hypothetical protein
MVYSDLVNRGPEMLLSAVLIAASGKGWSLLPFVVLNPFLLKAQAQKISVRAKTFYDMEVILQKNKKTILNV